MTALLDTTVALEGILFNTRDSDGVEWFGDLVEGWYNAPGERLQQTARPADNGVYDSRSYLEERLITMEGGIIAPTRTLIDAALGRFNALGTSGFLVPMTVAEPDGTRLVDVKRAQRPKVARVNNLSATFQLFLVAPDPRKFSATLQTASTAPMSDAPGGLAWNGSTGTTGVQWNGPIGTTGVVWQTGSGTPGVMTVVNGGSAPAPIRFVVTGPVTNPTIRNAATGEEITYGGVLLAGEELVVDTGSGAVTYLGQNRRPQLTSTQFFQIPPFESLLIAFDTAASGSGALLTAQWRDASY